MKIYLAARFSRRHECHALGQFLQARGHTIVSRWTLPGEDHVIPAGVSAQAADDERRRFAMEDMDDVRACDWCISLMEEPRSNGRGGRHIEFGVALGLGKRLTIIGPRETVFHHLDEVEHFETVDAFKRMHSALAGSRWFHPDRIAGLEGQSVLMWRQDPGRTDNLYGIREVGSFEDGEWADDAGGLVASVRAWAFLPAIPTVEELAALRDNAEARPESSE